MAFVSCGQFKQSQEEQDKKAVAADDALLDKSSGVGAGKVTVEKIKDALAGDVEVSVKPNSGINGNGTKENPLALNLGDTLAVDTQGNIGVDVQNASNEIGKAIAGDGLEFDEKTQTLKAKTVRLMDASGTVHLANVIEA